MRFCSNCNRVLQRDSSAGKVVYRCVCGEEVQGSAADARISGEVLGAGETTTMYRGLIRTAAFDRTNQQVMRACVSCGLDYMTQIRVGDAEAIVYKCKCGREESGAVRLD